MFQWPAIQLQGIHAEYPSRISTLMALGKQRASHLVDHHDALQTRIQFFHWADSEYHSLGWHSILHRPGPGQAWHGDPKIQLGKNILPSAEFSWITMAYFSTTHGDPNLKVTVAHVKDSDSAPVTV